MVVMGEGLRKIENGVESKLDMEVIRCLDSVHQLLSLRDTLSQTLRQGWMEMASARYAMGPSRVSQPIFSLKPHTASASVSVATRTSRGADDEDDTSIGSNVPVHMTLQRLSSATRSGNSSISKSSGTLGGPEIFQQELDQSKFLPTDWTQQEDATYKRMMQGWNDSGSDSESESTVSTQAKENTKPLQWFGALVSPHLRDAQSSFQSALEILVEIANVQGEAAHAHNQVIQERSDNSKGPRNSRRHGPVS